MGIAFRLMCDTTSLPPDTRRRPPQGSILFPHLAMKHKIITRKTCYTHEAYNAAQQAAKSHEQLLGCVRKTVITRKETPKKES